MQVILTYLKSAPSYSARIHFFHGSILANKTGELQKLKYKIKTNLFDFFLFFPLPIFIYRCPLHPAFHFVQNVIFCLFVMVFITIINFKKSKLNNIRFLTWFSASFFPHIIRFVSKDYMCLFIFRFPRHLESRAFLESSQNWRESTGVFRNCQI